MRTLRNIFRRKLRAFLTISGITIGVFALVVMGAMAEKITLLVDGGTKYYSDKVSVTEGGSNHSFVAVPMSVDKIGELETIDGVKAASAGLTMTLEQEQGASFGMPAMLIGSDLRGIDYETFEVNFASGRDLAPEDEGMAVVGSDLVKKLDAEVGGTITVRDREFEVVGIMEPTLTAPDTSVIIPLGDAQDIYYEDLPEFVRENIEKEKMATDITVYPEEGQDPDELATIIEEEIENVNTMGPAGFEDEIASTTSIFTTIVYGVAVISLLVGGLSVINTMIMSVYERTREIGIRKSLGASDWKIIRQFLGESGTIGLLGGLAGLFFGSAFVYFANAAGEEAGFDIFLLTNRLVLGSVLFAVFLGTASGLYPAWRAAQMNPVEALRYE